MADGAGATCSSNVAAHSELAAAAEALPVRRAAADVLATVRAGAVSIVVGETGSGKTTQLPQMLLDAPGLLPEGAAVAVTQPRRVAAIAVARRVAAERGGRVGGAVGYAVRFDECASSATKLKYLTDGTLLREMLSDPKLERYAAVVLDEAHERSLHTDVLFALLKRLVAARAGTAAPLCVVVMSATLDSAKLAAFFDDCPVLTVPGRQFPVELVYAAAEHGRDYVAAAAAVAADVHEGRPPGDILVFLAGQAEVEKAARLVAAEVAKGASGGGDLIVLPLYAAQPLELQARAFAPAPPGCRRCIVATNIAETSLTLDGVAYVVDSGVCKEKTYDAATGMERLAVQPISRVQAAQRAGRAGRTAPGTCFRLYTQRFFERDMPDVTAPEILRTPLLGAVLQLKSLPAALDIDVLRFDFVDAPAMDALHGALRHLYLLGAIDADGAITEVGRQVVQVPLEPQLARALLAALHLRCAAPMLTIAAMLSAETLFRSEPPKAARTAADDARIAQKQQLLAELAGDGVGDHVFLLRLAEACARHDLEADLIHTLRLNERGLAFARKVRSQLAGIVEQRVWPLLHNEERSSNSNAAPADGALDRQAANEDDGLCLHNGSAEAQPRKRAREEDDQPRLPDLALRPGDAATAGEVTRVRQALAIGYAPHLAKRMPMHNGYRTIAASKASVASVDQDAAKMHVEDGLLPSWLVFHSLTESARVTLRNVCAVEAEWVSATLARLQTLDTTRLARSGAVLQPGPTHVASEGSEPAPNSKAAHRAEGKGPDAEAISAAKARALARRAAGAVSKKRK